MKPTLVFIHGAFSGPSAFHYFARSFADYQCVSFAYNWNTKPSLIGRELADFVTMTVRTPSVILLGHSLGGNVAIHSLASFDGSIPFIIKRVITYSSPIGGSAPARFLRLVSKAQIFEHIHPSSWEVQTLQDIALQHHQYRSNITCFVSNRGPISRLSDGVITVASQTAIPGLHYIPVATNHINVLLSDSVIATTRQLIESK